MPFVKPGPVAQRRGSSFLPATPAGHLRAANCWLLGEIVSGQRAAELAWLTMPSLQARRYWNACTRRALRIAELPPSLDSPEQAT